MLDLGGGLGVDYEGGTIPNFDAYGQMVTRIFADRAYKLGFEPGRSIAADNGVFLTKTLFVKKGEDKRFIIVDGAMNDLIRPTLYEAFHRIEPVEPPRPETGLADIVGPVCETGDYLGQSRAMPEIAEGEVLAVLSAGAYGAVMMSNYNTRPEAAEVMIYNEAIHVLRPRRSVDDLLKLEDNPSAEQNNVWLKHARGQTFCHSLNSDICFFCAVNFQLYKKGYRLSCVNKIAVRFDHLLIKLYTVYIHNAQMQH